MSIHFQTFVLYGYRIDCGKLENSVASDSEHGLIESEFYDQYGYYNDRAYTVGDIVVISDGVGGEYTCLGIFVAATNSTRKGEQSFSEVVEPYKKIEDSDKEALDSLIYNWDIDAPNEQPQVLVFTHAR